MVSIAQILDWFKTGKKPTEPQFRESWLSFWHKEETIPQSAVSNLSATLNAKAEKAQFDGHKTDAGAHPNLVAKAKIYDIGQMQVFKKLAPDDEDYLPERQPGDYCVGFVYNEAEELEFISADYLGGDGTLKSSYDI